MAAADMFLKINGYKLQEAPFDLSEPNNLGLRDAHLALINNQWTAEQLGDYYHSTVVPRSRFGVDHVNHGIQECGTRVLRNMSC